jgi:voltage-gated potassium channel Kch
MNKPSFRARLRYQFDKSMAGGTAALIGWLGVVSLAIIVLAALILVISGIAPEGGSPLDFVEAVWEAAMRAMDAGTVGGDNGWPFRIVMLLVTLAGLFVVSALIGVLNTGLESRLDQLRKGRSLVLEQEHTIIYNWSPSIFDIIAELVIANESRHRPRIVIMSDRDKVEMEDEIAAKVPELKNTKIICRSGDPTDLYDVGIVNPQTCRSIIILSPEDEEGDSDSRVIKTILALVNDPNRRAAPYRIAAEIRETANAEIARVVGGNEVQLVLADDLIARIVVQSTRQPGLSAVFTELLDFDGCEIYTVPQPALTGKTFGEAILAYESCALIGLCGEDGTVSLNPPMSTVIAAGMQAILIAEDDDKIALAPRPDGERAKPPKAKRAKAAKPERTLLLGWNRRGPIIADELSRYVAPGSLLTIAADTPEIEEDVAGISLSRANLTIDLRRIDTSSAAAIGALDPTGYDSILVLGYSDHMKAQAADTRTLVTLLHLRGQGEKVMRELSVVSEMIDVRNRALAEVTRVNDFVVSNKLVSLMLAQSSENEHLEAIFKDLLDEEGSEICLKPVETYAPLDEAVSFYDLVDAAAARGEVAIGHHRLASVGDDRGRGLGGIVVNPSKSEKLAYQAGDRLIVLTRG